MSSLTEKMKQMVGYCTNCGTEIMDITRPRGKKALPNYAEHTMELSDGSMLKVAVCTTCKPLLVSGSKVEETANRILRHHKIYWEQHETDDHGDGRPNRFDKLTVADPGTNILKIRTKRLSSFDAEKEEKLAAERRSMEENRIARENQEAADKEKARLEADIEKKRKEKERLEKDEEKNLERLFHGKDPSTIK